MTDIILKKRREVSRHYAEIHSVSGNAFIPNFEPFFAIVRYEEAAQVLSIGIYTWQVNNECEQV